VFVEEFSLTQETEASEHRAQLDHQLDALKHMELARLEHRTHCDYVARIVGQIAHTGIKSDGAVKPTSSEIRDALSVAALADMLLHILDCYTYRKFRVSVEGKHLTMHGTNSQAEASYTWSSLRARSRELIDNYQLIEAIKKVEILAKTLVCESECFSDFLESRPGTGLLEASHAVRKDYARALRRDVGELIDLDFTVKTRSGSFQVEELLECWSLLFQLAIYARIWCRVFRRSSIAILPKTQLVSLVSKSLGCAVEQGERLVAQFSLDPREKNQDPFFRPLIQLDHVQLLIAASFIETSRFSRNLFTIAIREGSVNFSAKGLKPLRELYREFETAGFRVLMNLPIVVSGKTVTDVDIAATKDGLLFVGQTKVLIHPDTVYDDWKVLENLKKAANQLKTTLLNISLLGERFQLIEGEFLVVPFLLTNVWGLTGTSVGGFKVIDFSYLSNLLRGGEIWAVTFEPTPTREITKLIRGKYPTGEELAQLVLKPIHENMFEKADITASSVGIGEWTVTVPLDKGKIPSEATAGVGHQSRVRDFISQLSGRIGKGPAFYDANGISKRG
jgi:hypothetical protein